MSDEYSYERIDTDRREIRLLVIHCPPGTNSDLVCCDFKYISLLDDPVTEYKTISYAWGADYPKAKISIGGKQLVVPLNAEKALRCFRLPDQDRVLWIDAAYINQADDGEDGEKGPQVRYMSLIYSKSQGNLVHLGDDADGLGGLAFKTVRYLRDNRLSMLDDDAIKPDSDEARALSSLFSCPWFCRAWVVQEVVLGGPAHCFLGTHDIWIKAFLECALFVGMERKWQSDAGQLAEKFGRSAAMAIDNLITLRDVRQKYKEGWSGLQEKPDIATLLQRRRQCKDPRDMVYSIVGLWDPDVTRDIPPRLRIRYEASVPDVYRSTTRYSIRTRDGPYILHQVAHRTDGDLEENDIPAWAYQENGTVEEHNFPTWVPRWDRDTEEGAPHDLSVHFKCWHPWNALVKRADKCEDSIANILTLDGIMIDTVSAVTSPLRADQQRDPVALHSFVEAVERITRGVMDGDVTDSVAETLIAGCQNPHKLATAEHWAPYETFREHLTQIVKTGVDMRLPQAMHAGGGRKAYFTRLVTACLWRRFIATKDGHLGLAPRATREGDVLVALRNGMWPFVLRPMVSESGVESKYQFLGQAYLRGFMQGEIVQQCTDGRRETQTFSMV
ncbi:hypothetical protein EJ05DRAFT_331593 [Pseudovirgaria hyperparasitica]|uniref:Heterokaryon incompatibility domain-containing protein n=1 Tax=Pseudovirgaria hyperparasitica TaxID=470096 RepID=A0A6A6WB49_9PEZI|nr:uncharacterized protein EJ05DRAFT_331593 [Pseudovirgaria hyperparasitica]KAF2759066.1 hypothetical protein EJ05DRAFT_331593 [Pseudovirgaria hyperparasitica]